MKSQTLSTIGGCAIILWILLLLSGNINFYPFDTAEMVGYDFGQLVLPIIGIVCLVSARKKDERTEIKK